MFYKSYFPDKTVNFKGFKTFCKVQFMLRKKNVIPKMNKLKTL